MISGGSGDGSYSPEATEVFEIKFEAADETVISKGLPNVFCDDSSLIEEVRKSKPKRLPRASESEWQIPCTATGIELRYLPENPRIFDFPSHVPSIEEIEGQKNVTLLGVAIGFFAACVLTFTYWMGVTLVAGIAAPLFGIPFWKK